MVRTGAALGGEQSGHVILREVATTGDGILTALRVFAVMRAAGKGLDQLTEDLEVYPQRLVNVRVREKQGLLEIPAVKAEIARVEGEFGGTGRAGALQRDRAAGARDGGRSGPRSSGTV